MLKIESKNVPADIAFVVEPVDAGQTVEWSKGQYEGELYFKRLDRATQAVTYFVEGE